MIDRTTGIPPHRQELKALALTLSQVWKDAHVGYRSDERIQLEGETLYDCGLKDDSQIFLVEQEQTAPDRSLSYGYSNHRQK